MLLKQRHPPVARRAVSAMAARLRGASAQSRDGGAEVSFGGVPELLDQRMPLEHLLHDATLHTFSAAVDQPNLTQSGCVGRRDVLVNYRFDVSWRECVKVECVL